MSDLASPSQSQIESAPLDAITVGKTRILSESADAAEVYTMTLDGETMVLLPLRNWSQLDTHKWRARGKLPGTPAGLEITHDHVKVTGEAVAINDPDGTAKLQKLLNDWLSLERQTLALARQRTHAKAASAGPETAARPEDLHPHFRVEVDREGHVHLHCRQGKETLATIGLNLPGFNHLFNEGLLRKPRSLKVGAMHDWVELDGDFFSFEKGNNDAGKLEQALNGRYLCTTAHGQGKDVVVFTNAASSTGFDIQFAAKVGGVTERRRRPLNEEALDLLQDPEKCGLVHKDLVIKLSRPHLIFKRKTPDGGERYLDEGAESVVTVVGDEGELTIIDLTKPVNYLRLSAVAVTAIFNHPTINQHSQATPQPSQPSQAPAPAPGSPPAAAAAATPQQKVEPAPAPAPKPPPAPSPPPAPAKPVTLKPSGKASAPKPPQAARPLPNSWLQAVLSRASARPDWFACLVYTKLAEHFGNSSEGFFGPFPCWACSLGEVEDMSDPAFHGVFLTQKGGLGYLNQGQIARFRNEVTFIGTLESTIEGIGVSLAAVGADAQQRIVFIVNDGYRTKFGLPEQTVVEELARLKEHGAVVMSSSEVLHSPEPLEVVWTLPAEQHDPDDPQAEEHQRPEPSPAEATESSASPAP